MSLTVIVAAHDEAPHIARCIESVAGFATRVVVIDSGSTDATRDIAAGLGADVLQNPWSNHSRQINWGLANAAITTDWTFRLDADEIVLPELAARLADTATLPGDCAGFTVNRRIHFLGRWLRHGGLYPVHTLRLWRTGRGRCEDRWMDEQMLVDGRVGHIDADLADINLRNIGWWTAKHNDYATREAIEELLAADNRATRRSDGSARIMDPRARMRRWVKLRLYGALPFGIRAPLIVVYRYVLRLGFLDGWQGLVYYCLQAGWFRFLVDVKMREITGLMAARTMSLSAVVEAEYGLRLEPVPDAGRAAVPPESVPEGSPMPPADAAAEPIIAPVATHAIESPTGTPLQIPVTPADDRTYFRLDDADAARDYYIEHGYVVFRGVVPPAMTAAARAAWDAEMKPHRGYVYRQATGKPEHNSINDRGFVMNPVLNLQDLQTRHFGTLKQATLDIYASDPLRRAVMALIGADPKLVQSMYFEGNSATWAHQDTYYLDSERIGGMVAAWIALEDIEPGAGRFYIYPGSHRIDIEKNGGNFDIAFNHDRYKQLIIDVIARYDLECRAPALADGDVLLWNARTIHGSLMTNQPDRSRSSLTAHFIPAADRFLQFQSRIKRTAIIDHRGLAVQTPKNQDLRRHRAMLAFETSFPKSYQFVRDRAIKLLTR